MVAIKPFKKMSPAFEKLDLYFPITDGNKFQKLSQKELRFNRAMFQNHPVLSDVGDIDKIYNIYEKIYEPTAYESTVMSVKTSRDGANRYITYDLKELMEPNGFQFLLCRSVSLTGEADADFRAYLKASGIKDSYWHDYVGCQEFVMLHATPSSGDIFEVVRFFYVV